jgi:hypothetical protein
MKPVYRRGLQIPFLDLLFSSLLFSSPLSRLYSGCRTSFSPTMQHTIETISMLEPATGTLWPRTMSRSESSFHPSESKFPSPFELDHVYADQFYSTSARSRYLKSPVTRRQLSQVQQVSLSLNLCGRCKTPFFFQSNGPGALTWGKTASGMQS